MGICAGCGSEGVGDGERGGAGSGQRPGGEVGSGGDRSLGKRIGVSFLGRGASFAERPFAVTRGCLEQLISDLEDSERRPSNSAYELQRQHTAYDRWQPSRALLLLAQQRLQDAPAGSWNSVIAYLKDDVHKAEARVSEAVCASSN